jgi:hypothetical protein
MAVIYCGRRIFAGTERSVLGDPRCASEQGDYSRVFLHGLLAEGAGCSRGSLRLLVLVEGYAREAGWVSKVCGTGLLHHRAP